MSAMTNRDKAINDLSALGIFLQKPQRNVLHATYVQMEDQQTLECFCRSSRGRIYPIHLPPLRTWWKDGTAGAAGVVGTGNTQTPHTSSSSEVTWQTQ